MPGYFLVVEVILDFSVVIIDGEDVFVIEDDELAIDEGTVGDLVVEDKVDSVDTSIEEDTNAVEGGFVVMEFVETCTVVEEDGLVEAGFVVRDGLVTFEVVSTDGCVVSIVVVDMVLVEE